MNHSRRILFLDQSGGLGGAELSLLDLANALKGGCAVFTFADGLFPEALGEKGISHKVFPFSAEYTKAGGGGYFRLLKSVPSVIHLIKRIACESKQFHVVVANTPKAALIGAIAARFARRPFVYHLRDMLTEDHFSPMNRMLLVQAGNTARRVVCNSEATRDAFVAAGGKAGRTEVVYNGIDLSPFIAASETTTVANRQALDLPPNAFLIAIAGRLTPWKGQHILLEAVKKVPGAHVMIIGDALFTDEDRDYAAHLKQLAEHNDLAGRVHFLGFRQDLPALYAAADVVVHASTAPEPFGRVIVEGMLAGKPVIASRAGGAREIVNEGETGLLFELGSAPDLAANLRTLTVDTGLRERLGISARKNAIERFSLENILPQLEDILQSVAEEHTTGRTRSGT
jgi:glycosyltransferase involved in cell wall biosynthesis